MPISVYATNTKAIEDAFAGIVRGTGYNGADMVLIEPYNGPRPLQAYATVHLVTVESQDHAIKQYETRPDGSFAEVVKATSWCRVILQFFGGDAMAKAVKVRTALFSQARLWDLFPTMGMGGIGEIQDISGSYQAKVEQRARFTVDFYADLSAEYDALYIAKVKGDIAVDGGDVPFGVKVRKKRR